MSPSHRTTTEVRPGPTVEQRLDFALAAMDCLQQIAFIADEEDAIPLFHDVREFAGLVSTFSWATETHLRAIKKALPVSCTKRHAAEIWPGGES